VTSLNSVSVSPSTRRHVTGQAIFGIWSKIDVVSTAMKKRSNSLALLASEHRLKIVQQTRDFANVAYDLLTYNMESATPVIASNSKWRHCHLMCRHIVCTWDMIDVNYKLWVQTGCTMAEVEANNEANQCGAEQCRRSLERIRRCSSGSWNNAGETRWRMTSTASALTGPPRFSSSVNTWRSSQSDFNSRL